MDNIGDVVFDAMLKEAVTANFRAEMEGIPSGDELERSFSDRHIRKMKALFAYERRQIIVKKVWSFAKAAALFFCILTTITFLLLAAINPEGLTGIFSTGTDTPAEVSAVVFHAVKNEYHDYHTETHDGIEYHIYTSLDVNLAASVIVWTREGFSFSISGQVPVDELLKAARSLE